MTKVLSRLLDLLFTDSETSLYVVLDGASISGLTERLDADAPSHLCLYRGDLSPDLRVTAPYLVQLQPEDTFTKWILEKGWGHHWGIFLLSREGIVRLRRHLRTFLKVRGPEGEVLYFRYYDPRVFRVYLPTCLPDEIAQIYGPVSSYLMEGEKPDVLLRFDANRRRLVPRVFSLREE